MSSLHGNGMVDGVDGAVDGVDGAVDGNGVMDGAVGGGAGIVVLLDSALLCFLHFLAALAYASHAESQ